MTDKVSFANLVQVMKKSFFLKKKKTQNTKLNVFMNYFKQRQAHKIFIFLKSIDV